MLLCGRFRILLLYDVAEGIDLKALREILGPRGEQVKREFPRRTPEYVRSEDPPVVEPSDPLVLDTGETGGTLASTIVELTGDTWRVGREGAIRVAEIEKALE